MRTAITILLCLAMAIGAYDRTGFSGANPPAANRGTYTVVESYAVGLSSAYGLAIQEDATNSIWISQYSPLVNNEFEMSTGMPSGYTWDIDDGVDPDDMGYADYPAAPSQFLFGDWAMSRISVYDVSTTGAAPYHTKYLEGPGGWDTVCGVDAGYGCIYASDFFVGEIAWGSYEAGLDTTVTWTTAPFEAVSGMAVWSQYLFVCCQVTGADNIFIFQLEPDGCVNMTPIWSCEFTETASSMGGIDFDGEYLWLYPQNDNLYKLDIDWEPTALQQTTWGDIKAWSR